MSEKIPILEAEELVVQRGNFRLEIPSLRILKGEILTLVGPNGSGKTTLLMSLGLILTPHSGSIRLYGGPTRGLATPLELRRKVVMVFQEPLLLRGSVLENVSLGLRLRGFKGRHAEEAAMMALERLGIAHLRERDVRKISAGEAQRVNVARALAVEPEVLLLDEPFSSLDPPSRDTLLEDLEGLLRTHKTTAVLTTHDRLDALTICDKVAVMNHGRILQMGPPAEVVQNPAHPFVAEFFDLNKLAQRLAHLLSRRS